MNIYFDNITIKNFLSFEDATLNFNDFCGYVSIIGENKNPNDSAKSNGSGKSALFDALCWALTGETVRGVKDVKNIFTDGDANVELEFNIDDNHYKVIRTKGKASSLKLIKNDKDISGKGVRDTEEILKQTLGDIDKTLIGSVILLGQGMPDRFSNNTPSGRKEVLENLSKSNYMIEDLSSRVATRKTDIDKEIKENELNDAKLSTELSSVDYQITELEHKIVDNEWLENAKSENENLKKEIDGLQITLNEKADEYSRTTELLTKLRNDYTVANANMNNRITEACKQYVDNKTSLDNDISALKAKQHMLSTQINKIKTIKDVCPTCGQKLPNVHKPSTKDEEQELADVELKIQECIAKKSEYDNIISETTKSVKQSIESEISELTLKGKEQKSIVDNINGYISSLSDDISNKNNIFNSKKAQIEMYEKNLAENRESLAKLNARYDSIAAKIEDNAKQYDILKKRLEINKKFSTALSRDFRGILLEDIIAYLNKVIAKYSQTVFGHSNLKLELDKNNLNIVYSDKYYESLSGGERQKVDVIIQFALRYMLCNMLNFSCNIIVLDEVFDNCDIEGCDKIIELISKELSDIQSVFIITHHAFELSLPTDYDIIITKNINGISHINV